MANDTLPVGIIVEIDHPRANFLAKITEVSATHVMDDVWYRVEPIPGEKDQQQGSKGWYHMKHVSEIDLLTQS